MLKKFVFIDNPHNKNAKLIVYLYTFTTVIINITKFPLVNPQNPLGVKGFQEYWKPFFYAKKPLY